MSDTKRLSAKKLFRKILLEGINNDGDSTTGEFVRSMINRIDKGNLVIKHKPKKRKPSEFNVKVRELMKKIKNEHCLRLQN